MSINSLSKALFALLTISSATCIVAQEQAYNYPGGVAQIKLTKESDHLPLPDVKYGISQPVILERHNHWLVLIGLSLDTLPGEYLVYVKSSEDDSQARHEKFRVQQKTYPSTENSIERKDLFNKTDSIFSDIGFQNTQQPSLPLDYPAKGNWDETFGLINYDKKQQSLTRKNVISLEVIKATRVMAPQNAIVSKISIDDDGIAHVFLDHGRGLYSVVGGITDLSVEIGNGVLRGAVIGWVSLKPTSAEKTSRHTSRTVTWQSLINDVYVNPTIFTKFKPTP